MSCVDTTVSSILSSLAACPTDNRLTTKQQTGISKNVEGHVEEKLKYVEGSIQNAMAHRVAALESNIQSKVCVSCGCW